MPPISYSVVTRDDVTAEQKLLARELAMPDGATTLTDLAAAINCTTEQVESWFRDPHFRGFLIQELDARSAITVSLLWRMIGRTALDASRPETRIECAKLYLARFDPGLRAGLPDAAKSVERFAEDIAQRAVAAALPKDVKATPVAGKK